MLKSDIIWPEHRRYKSRTEWEPIGFFSDCLCNTTHFDLMLGFFSSSAISVLANGFAVFLYNGGRMRLIVNDILTEEDKNAIADGAGDVEIPYLMCQTFKRLKKHCQKEIIISSTVWHGSYDIIALILKL